MFSHAWQTGATGKRSGRKAVPREDGHRFDQLVLLHQEIVYTCAYRLLGDARSATNVTQQSFLAARQAMPRVDDGSFKLYVLRLVADICRDRLRSLASQRDQRPTTGSGRESVAWQAEAQDQSGQSLQAGILTLPAEERIVLVLADVLGLGYGDIAQVTNSGRSMVRDRLAHGRARLRDYLVNSNQLQDV